MESSSDSFIISNFTSDGNVRPLGVWKIIIPPNRSEMSDGALDVRWSRFKISHLSYLCEVIAHLISFKKKVIFKSRRCWKRMVLPSSEISCKSYNKYCERKHRQILIVQLIFFLFSVFFFCFFLFFVCLLLFSCENFKFACCSVSWFHISLNHSWQYDWFYNSSVHRRHLDRFSLVS